MGPLVESRKQATGGLKIATAISALEIAAGDADGADALPGPAEATHSGMPLLLLSPTGSDEGRVSASQGVDVNDVVKKKKNKQSKSKKKAFENVLEQMRIKPTDLTAIVGAGGISVVLQ